MDQKFPIALNFKQATSARSKHDRSRQEDEDEIMLMLLLAVAETTTPVHRSYTTVANLNRERSNDNRNYTKKKFTDMGLLRLADDNLVCDNMITLLRRSCFFQSQRPSEKILPHHKATDIFLYIGPRFVIINQIVMKVLAQ